MDKSIYNSLTNQLIQNGIIPNDGLLEDNQGKTNFFEKNIEEAKEAKETNDNIKSTFKKRLNRFEYEPTGSQNSIKASFLGNSKKEKFFIRFFPKLYKAYLAKNALKELTELDIDTNELLSKTIPYGEEESRYKNLVKYLKYANDVQIKIENKFN